MLDYKNYLIQRNYSLQKTLKSGDENEVLLVRRSDGTQFVLRVYSYEVPVYAALLGHNCIYLPAVYRFYAAEGLYFVEEEYIDGISAAELLQGGEHCSKTRTLEIAKAVLGAAEELHRKGFIHRDIKPEHILLTADGRIVLVDLGASMQIRPEKSGDTQLLGTAGYAAPEQFGFSRSDARTDIYAVGILLNELLTGVHPSVKLYREGNLGQIIEKCISMNPQDRYQTIEELEAELRREIETDSVFSSEASNPVNHSSGKKKAIFAGILIIIAIAGSIFAASKWQAGEENPKGSDLQNIAGTEEDRPAVAEGSDYLQLYKDGNQTQYFNTIQGSQSSELRTEDGQIIDQSFHVYIDEGAGQVTWSDELGAWDVVTTGCRPGTKGYLHAEKGGKHYAIEVTTFAEPMSVYSCLPDINDLGKGWLKARRERPTAFEEGWLTVDYKKGEEVELYLVAAYFFTLDGIDCDNPDVTIEELKTPIGNYPFPVAKLTYRSSKGGDAEFTVTSELNNYHIQMNEI